MISAGMQLILVLHFIAIMDQRLESGLALLQRQDLASAHVQRPKLVSSHSQRLIQTLQIVNDF